MKIFQSWIWPILAVILIIIAMSMECTDEQYPGDPPVRQINQSK